MSVEKPASYPPSRGTPVRRAEAAQGESERLLEKLGALEAWRAERLAADDAGDAPARGAGAAEAEAEAECLRAELDALRVQLERWGLVPSRVQRAARPRMCGRHGCLSGQRAVVPILVSAPLLTDTRLGPPLTRPRALCSLGAGRRRTSSRRCRRPRRASTRSSRSCAAR